MRVEATGHSADAYESKFELTIVLMCSMAGTLMQALDTTIANVALPHMQGSLQASRDQITWVLTSYIIAAAIMTAPVGWIASRFGKRNFILVALGGFTVTSMLCGAAQTLDQMILFRLLQGAFERDPLASDRSRRRSCVFACLPVERSGVQPQGLAARLPRGPNSSRVVGR